MKFNIIILAVILFLLQACVKPPVPQPIPVNKKILVDASRDGGVWWSPQSGQPGNANAPHQGKKLADYLKSLGYQVDELSSGTTITWPLLKQYTRIIRAGGFGNYSPGEIEAYDSFLSRPSSLMLLQDHLSNYSNDLLSEHLGVEFTGSEIGHVTKFAPHSITAGVTLHDYVAGSTVSNSIKNSGITVLGWLGPNDYPVMGILHYPTARIFFIGDMNGLEQVPQPFSGNLIKWLF
ncbi:MAG: hypothetical protein WKF97_19715 [Chitinophagaceae bacterium]